MVHAYLTDEQLENWKDLQGNFTTAPNYLDLVRGIWNTISWYYAPHMWRDYDFPRSFVNDFLKHFYFPLHQVFYIVFIAVAITVLRYVFEEYLCKPLANWLELSTENEDKFPESVWKCCFYTCAWSFNAYLLHYRYDYFHNPYLIWDDWAPGMTVPFDIKLMYFVQCGFYLHSIYGTLRMDHRLKDFYAMLLHHVLTMALIFVSYATRYHKVGLLVLYVHDITDIWLELAKALHYLSMRKGGRECPRWESAATVFFVIFVLCWFLFRLYWYPMKVLYSTGVVTAFRAYDKGCGLYGFFNSLLWLLFGLNIYWLYFILKLLLRVSSGSSNGLEDTREDKEAKSPSTKTPVAGKTQDKKKK